MDEATARNDPHRILAVIDWSVDPGAVVDVARARDDGSEAIYSLLVPARLPGLDWVGDPEASRPCACEQLERAKALFAQHGLAVEAARVGDPERLPAIADALADSPADEIVIFDRARRFSFCHALSLVRRARRRTGLSVRRTVVQLAPTHARRRRLIAVRVPRCRTAE